MRALKAFRAQFIDCKKQGMVVNGETKTFKDHPEALPMPWSKAAKTIIKAIEKNPNAGFTLMKCLRFGGECSSKNTECRKCVDL